MCRAAAVSWACGCGRGIFDDTTCPGPAGCSAQRNMWPQKTFETMTQEERARARDDLTHLNLGWCCNPGCCQKEADLSKDVVKHYQKVHPDKDCSRLQKEYLESLEYHGAPCFPKFVSELGGHSNRDPIFPGKPAFEVDTTCLSSTDKDRLDTLEFKENIDRFQELIDGGQDPAGVPETYLEEYQKLKAHVLDSPQDAADWGPHRESLDDDARRLHVFLAVAAAEQQP